MDDRYVAGIEPIIGVDAILDLLEIALHHGRPAGLEPAGGLAVARLHVAGIVDDPQLYSEHRASGPNHVRELLVLAHGIPVRGRSADGPNRRHFGHPPQVIDPDA